MRAVSRPSRLAMVVVLCGLAVGDAASQRPQTTPATSRDAAPEPHASAAAVLPVLMLDLDGPSVSQDRETSGILTVVETHSGSHTDLATSPVSRRSRVSLEIHGESSSSLAKKSYQLELADDDTSFLGLPPGSDWVLHGCGADRTCLRNVLAYDLGRELGNYTPRTRFVELFVDDAYQGLYVVVERVRRGRHRVNLNRLSAMPAEGDITGGYIFKMDLGEGDPTDKVRRDWVSPVSGTVYSYYYPRFNRITPAQKSYLHDHVSRFETMMRSSRWNNPDVGYRQWLHVPSWVDFALMQELSVNPDAYFKSVYLQKLPRAHGDRIALGPIWDFDLAFGVAEFRDARNTRSWAHRMNRFGVVDVRYDPPGDLPFVPAYWERLWTDAAFRRDLKCRWVELRAGPLQERVITSKIDGWAAELVHAQPRDAAVWGNPPANAYAGEVQSLKTFLRARLAWMDANLPGTCPA